ALSMNFIITTDDILLKYLGGRFDYGGDFERDDWIEVHPKKTIFFTQVLNDNYEFLPGKRIYNIGSLEYAVVNEGWFIDKSIYSNLISITKPKADNCHVKEKASYVLKKRLLCMSHLRGKELSLEQILGSFGFHNFYTINGNKSFRIRTDQIVVEIDGDKISSLYEKR
ncbi:transposase, partial [Salmonella enterica]|nr:transposase [Salmonella enterica]